MAHNIRMVCYAGEPLLCKVQQMRNKRGALLKVTYCQRCKKIIPGEDRNHKFTQYGGERVEVRASQRSKERKYY